MSTVDKLNEVLERIKSGTTSECDAIWLENYIKVLKAKADLHRDNANELLGVLIDNDWRFGDVTEMYLNQED